MNCYTSTRWKWILDSRFWSGEKMNSKDGCPVRGAWQSGLLQSIINRLLACIQECWAGRNAQGWHCGGGLTGRWLCLEHPSLLSLTELLSSPSSSCSSLRGFFYTQLIFFSCFIFPAWKTIIVPRFCASVWSSFLPTGRVGKCCEPERNPWVWATLNNSVVKFQRKMKACWTDMHSKYRFDLFLLYSIMLI